MYEPVQESSKKSLSNLNLASSSTRKIPRPPSVPPPSLPLKRSSSIKSEDRKSSSDKSQTEEHERKSSTASLPPRPSSTSRPPSRPSSVSRPRSMTETPHTAPSKNQNSKRSGHLQKRSVSFSRQPEVLDSGQLKKSPSTGSLKSILKHGGSSERMTESPMSMSVSAVTDQAPSPSQNDMPRKSRSKSRRRESPKLDGAAGGEPSRLDEPPKKSKSSKNRKRSSSKREQEDRQTTEKNLPVTPTESLTVPASNQENQAPPSSSSQPIMTPPKISLFDHVGQTESDFVDKIMSIQIHESDPLPANVHVKHPIVRVSLLDLNTGQYILKSSPSRKVTSVGEAPGVGIILPVLTQSFNLSAHGTKHPEWEDQILLNEDYLYLLQPHVILTFEILDFITSKKMLGGPTDGWYKVAWGFLKLVGGDGRANTEKNRLRIQLYRYPLFDLSLLSRDRNKPAVYYAFKGRRSKYPGTLWVTVKGVPKLDTREVKARSRLPTEIEVGKTTLEQVN